jgi:hypothetical protein
MNSAPRKARNYAPSVRIFRFDMRYEYRRVSCLPDHPNHRALMRPSRLIAIMLGRLRLSVDKAIEAYGRFASHVFSDKKQFWKDGMFKALKLEDAVKAIIQESIGDPNTRMLDMRSNDVCKTYVQVAVSS